MITLEFTKPTVANFVNFHRNSTPVTVPIQDLTKEEVTAYAELVKRTIFENWENKQGKTESYRQINNLTDTQ